MTDSTAAEMVGARAGTAGVTGGPEDDGLPSHARAAARTESGPTDSGRTEAVDGSPSALWSGDTGTLHEASRRVLLELLKGPYVSGAQNPGLWTALVADQATIRSRLHDLFLDLVLDEYDEFAFTRKVETHDLQVPSALRAERLTFLDTAMLLVLRQFLLTAPGEERVIVGQDEVYEQLSVYRDGDESTFLRNLNGSWGRMVSRLRVLHSAGEDRFQISPMVRFLIDEDRVRELTAVYRRIAGGEDPGGEAAGGEAAGGDAGGDVDERADHGHPSGRRQAAVLGTSGNGDGDDEADHDLGDGDTSETSSDQGERA